MKNFGLLRSLALGASLAFSSLAHAQSARVTAIQAVAEKRPEGAPAWAKVNTGAEVRTGDSVRTGKRSKADLKFGDGSLIRLGQLSTLEVRGERDTRLATGQLLFSFLKPGRILAGAGAAEIKGTAGIISLDKDGNAQFVLYKGLLDVVTKIKTIQLTPGSQVTLSASGVLGAIGVAAPLQFAGGQRFPDLLTSPVQGPFVGSGMQLGVRDSNQYRSVEIISDQVRSTSSQSSAFNPFVSGNSGSGTSGSGAPTPFPTPTSNPVPTPFPTLPGVARTSAASSNRTAGETPVLLAANTADSNPVATGAVPTPGANRGAGSAPSFGNGAEKHLGEADLNLGADSGSDIRLIGAIADGGATVFGGRIHGYAAKGHWYLDGAVTPLRIARNVGGQRQTDNQTTVSDLSATYRAPKTEFQIGRQRYLEGPTQATLFGSLIRAGGREIMDSARLAHALSSSDKVEVSYLYDAYVRQLPYSVPGPQKGFAGRYQHNSSWANLGVNLLKYTNSPGQNTLGATGDLAVPLISQQLELYAEAGRDPFRRRLTSFGIYLPGLYQKTGFDVYIEYAQLKSSSLAPGPPNETAIRIYRRINKYADAMLTASRFSDHTSSVILGLSFGDPIGGQ